MDRGVDRAIGERLFELLYEEALAAHIGERRRGNLVAAGTYLDDFDFDAGDFRGQQIAHDRRLGERQFAGTRADADFERHPENLIPKPFPSGKGDNSRSGHSRSASPLIVIGVVEGVVLGVEFGA